jgi:hypothetical protein
MRLNIVKQSDVSFGTALHYAEDWTYGRNALCGKTMRATVRDGEAAWKRMCGTCARIMAKRVETAHAEALEIAKDRLDIPDFDEEAVYAQAERALAEYRVTCAPTLDHPAERMWTVTASSAGAAQERVCQENNLTWSHIHAGLITTALVDAAEKENIDCPPECGHGRTEKQGCHEGGCDFGPDLVLRLKDTRTGLIRRVLGTTPAANAPHLTQVWIQREGEQGAQAWSADQLMSTWHDLVAVDENNRTNAETAEITAYEQARFEREIAAGMSQEDAVATVGIMRRFASRPGAKLINTDGTPLADDEKQAWGRYTELLCGKASS